MAKHHEEPRARVGKWITQRIQNEKESAHPTRLVRFGVPPPPLHLSDKDRKALRRALREAKEFADHVARLPQSRGYLAAPSDALMPDSDEAADRLIRAPDDPLLVVVESNAASRANRFQNLRSRELDRRIADLDKQRRALADARVEILDVSEMLEAAARIRTGSAIASKDIRHRVSVTLSVIKATDDYLKTHLEEDLLQIRRQRRKGGKPVDMWRAELIETLAHWWLTQGWNPTASKNHAFANVVAIILTAHARRHGTRLSGTGVLKSLRLREPLAQVKAKWVKSRA